MEVNRKLGKISQLSGRDINKRSRRFFFLVEELGKPVRGGLKGKGKKDRNQISPWIERRTNTKG